MKSETVILEGNDSIYAKFQSTHSMKSETKSKKEWSFWNEISIHSLNEEWDKGLEKK